MIRTGDTIRHRPSGETWLVAGVDGEYLYAYGWPETMAHIHNCDLIAACSDEKHLACLKELAGEPGKLRGDSRGRIAHAVLLEMRVPEYVTAYLAQVADLLDDAQREVSRWQEELDKYAGVEAAL